jgi:hypothetical protein
MVDGVTRGRASWEVISRMHSKFRAVLFPPETGQIVKPFNLQQFGERKGFGTGSCCGRSLLSVLCQEDSSEAWISAAKIATDVAGPAEMKFVKKQSDGVPGAAWSWPTTKF